MEKALCRIMRVFFAPLAALLLCGFTQPQPVVFDASGTALAAGGIAKIQGLLSKPEGNGPFPAIVILHTCGGVRQNLSHVWPDLLVELGYVSLTVDSFGSRGVGNCPNDFTRRRSTSGTAPYVAIASDAHSALTYLQSRPFAKKHLTAAIGFSLGGIAIHFGILPSYARARPANGFKAAISLYGNCEIRKEAIPMPRLNRSPIPLLEIIGEKDERILRACKKHLPRHPSVDLHILPDTYHAFDIRFFTTMRRGHAGAKMLYSEIATRAARKLVKAFLDRHLGH